MKKALQISLARTVFTLEEDAYARLDEYLNSIRTLFATVEGREDILADIESRIAEQFLEGGKSVVTIAEVERVIESMGRAEDYQENAEIPVDPEQKSEGLSKKFYRDPQGAMLGGVCTGLANYVGIDVIWIRLAFVIAAFINGLGILAYLVIWLIAPEAKTSSQRLEMEGIPVTLGTLKHTTRDTLRNVGSISATRIHLFVRRLIELSFRIGRALIGIGLTGLSVTVILGLSTGIPFLLANPRAEYFPIPLTDIISAPLLWATMLIAYLFFVLPSIFALLLGLSIFRSTSILSARTFIALFTAWCAVFVAGSIVSARAFSDAHHFFKTSPIFYEETRSVPLNGIITSLEIEDGLSVYLSEGDEQGMEVGGTVLTLDRLNIEIENNTLVISADENSGPCPRCSFYGARVSLTLPELDALSLTRGARLQGVVNADTFTIDMGHGSFVFLEGAINNLDISAAEGSRANIVNALTVGGATSLNANHGSSIEISGAYESATVIAREGARILLGPILTLDATVSGGSSVRYEGSPEIVQRVVTDGSILGPANDLLQ